MPGPQGEFLEGEDPFAAFDARHVEKTEDKNAALIWAQKYKVFESGVAKELLDHWTRQVRHRKIAPSAGATEFAYHAGMREFIESIYLQIEFANNGGLSPYREV
jgi:hypothetical protein